MHESIWITAYAVLAVGVISALAVSLMTARQLGRLISHSSSDGAEEASGLRPETRFPDVAVYDVEGLEVRPAAWPVCLLLQVAVTREADLEMLQEFRGWVRPEMREYTAVSVMAFAAPVGALAAALAPVHVVDDRAGVVEAAVATKYRPHAVLMAGGRVVRSATFESVAEVEAFVAQASAERVVGQATGAGRRP